ncbi:MAG: 2-oxo acid dehydrogenase subunit E2 [Bacillota bacterium]
MHINVGMPKFGLSMEEGTISAWLVKEGGAVKKGDPIAEIQSEKLTNNAVAPCDGSLVKILLREGESAPCGGDICAIECAGGDPEAVPKEAPGQDAAPEAAKRGVPLFSPRAKALAERAGVNAPSIAGTGENNRVLIGDVRRAMEAPKARERAAQTSAAGAYVSPAGRAPGSGAPAKVPITPRARKYAEQAGLAYAHIAGSGLLGMITIEDVKAHGRPALPGETAEKAQAAPAETLPAAARTAPGDGLVPMTAIRRATAEAMKKSLLESAQTTVMAEAHVAPLKELYERLKPKYLDAGVKLSYTALIVKAVAMALEEHPDIRLQVYDERSFRLSAQIDIGVAADAPAGLFVPVIRNANIKDIRTISLELEELAARNRAGKLSEGDAGGACMSVSNLGMLGVTGFTPVLNPPESAMLGVCAMVDRPVARGGGIRIEPVMNLCLTYDHRAINGAPAARFLQKIVQNLVEFAWI